MKKLLTPVMIGLSDGLVIPFAFIAGLSMVLVDTSQIYSIVILITVFASVLMAVGGFLTVRDETHLQDTGKLSKEVDAFYANIDLPEEYREQAVSEVLSDRKTFDELAGPEPAAVSNPVSSALFIFFGYCIGGFISLLPYFFMQDVMTALKVSAILTIPLLFFSGALRFWLTDRNPWKGAMQQGAIGVVAAGGAMGVGLIVGQV